MIAQNMYVAPPTTKGGTDGALTLTAGGPSGTGTTLAAGTLLTSNLNVITTCGGAGYSVCLPLHAQAGEVVFVSNLTATNAMNVFPATATGTINGGSAGAAVSLAITTSKTKNSLFICYGNDVWIQYISG